MSEYVSLLLRFYFRLFTGAFSMNLSIEKDAHSHCNKNEADSSDSDMEVEQPAVMRKVSTHKQIKSKVR